jgi:hypothetical protein
MATAMSTEECFLLLGALLESRRAAFKTPVRIAFMVVDAGPYVVDTTARQIVEPGWRNDLELSILCNQRTLVDLLAGNFDLSRPGPEHLFVWGGDRAVWSSLARAFQGATSTVGARLAALGNGAR